jgi:hypothetical protein
MGIITKKLAHVVNFNLRLATKQAIDQNKSRIAGYNKEQLLEGKTAQDKDMPAYTKFTLQKKPAAFIPSNKSYSLKDSGKLHANINVTADLEKFEITSTDPRKAAKLQQTDDGGGMPVSEEEAFGLTEKNREKLCREILLPYYRLKLRKKA